jgi:integrase
VHAEVAPTLKNEHNKVVWLSSLDKHIFHVFGKKTVDTVDSADVLRASLPIWTTKPDMARKTLARIRRVMDWATIRGYRNVVAGDIVVPRPNPCIGIQVALPKQPKDGTHAALSFIETMRAGTSSLSVTLAVEFTILTCSRTSEALEATWNEIDVDGKVWNVTRRTDESWTNRTEFPYPIAVSKSYRKRSESPMAAKWCLSRQRRTRHCRMWRCSRRFSVSKDTKNSPCTVSARALRPGVTRKQKYDSLVIEAALAHKVEGIERDYLRTTFFEQRLKLMQDWARFVTASPAAKVVKMRV